MRNSRHSFSLFGFPLLSIYLLIGQTNGLGQWVFLSRPDSSVSASPSSSSASSSSSSSSSPFDFCVLGVQSFRANASGSATSPDEPQIRFRGADSLLRSRPLHRKSYRDVFVTRDPRAGCVDGNVTFPMVAQDVTGKIIVQVIQCFSDPNNSNKTICPRCCQYPTKAAVAKHYSAAGYVALAEDSSFSSSSSPLPPLPNMTTRCGTYGDLSPDSLAPVYDIDVVYAEDINGSLEWLLDENDGAIGSNNSSPHIVVWNLVYFPWENVFNWSLIGFIATVSMTAAAYASGRLSYQLYRQKFAARVRKLIKDGNSIAAQESGEGDDGEKGISTPDVIVGLVAFIFISLFLILIYFVKWLAVPIFLVIFAMSSLSLFTLTRPLIDRLPFGARRLGCVMFLPCGCCGGGRNCCNWEVREVLAAVVFLSLGWTWYFLRHDKIVILLLHNFLGFSLVYHVSNGIRVTRFQACVYPCILLLIYDVFMVFITPYMTAGGMSVMESVARGTEGDDLPLVFKIPALFPTTENVCSGREVAGLLGFGDVVLPAILASYMVLVGFVLGKPRQYIGATFLSYPVSLVVTIVSLYFMQVAQPALLYIVPIMMLAIVITAAASGDLKTLWNIDMMSYPRTLEARHLRLYEEIIKDKQANDDGQEGGEDAAPIAENGSVLPASGGDEEEEDEARVNINEPPVQNASGDTSSLIHRNVTDRANVHA